MIVHYYLIVTIAPAQPAQIVRLDGPYKPTKLANLIVYSTNGTTMESAKTAIFHVEHATITLETASHAITIRSPHRMELF